MPGSWQDRLKEEVPREEIPAYLTQLQALVAELRRWRDAQRIPGPEQVRPHLTPLLRRHSGLTLDYIAPADYRAAVERALL